MSMHNLMMCVKELIESEYGRAGAKYGLTNHSDHESYAVILEELQEASDELRFCGSALEDFWELVKQDCTTEKFKADRLDQVYKRAMLGACELIQVAAMAKKASITICDRGVTKEFKGEQSV